MSGNYNNNNDKEYDRNDQEIDGEIGDRVDNCIHDDDDKDNLNPC